MTRTKLAADDMLAVEGFSASFDLKGELRPVLKDVTFSLPSHSMSAIVGESGSGKSLTALSVLGLAPRRLVRTSGQIRYRDSVLTELSERELRTVRGARIAMVFQDARAALNPVFTVGHQLEATVRAHQKVSRKQAKSLAADALASVRIPDVSRRMEQYPHQFSGGMAQRVALAQTLLCDPELLLLDEPTTGLDVTIQADVMDLITTLGAERHMTTCLITHDLGLVGQYCDRVIVMKAGEVCEQTDAKTVFSTPTHPYTQLLLDASELKQRDTTERRIIA
ncbi:MAG: oligopeptide/dipeptide transporter, ATPase subunit [Glaciihabitans sp.]|nr:oligopeptide/dipeptide transporter, ATPase subunit [Glaciihabitans sp.]